ncbi:MAG: hypothetical protein LUH13_00190, partial [Oscillospiraceae bacterium]|nr:hypothetical protein [Oscillospiraceae bacterium]
RAAMQPQSLSDPYFTRDKGKSPPKLWTVPHHSRLPNDVALPCRGGEKQNAPDKGRVLQGTEARKCCMMQQERFWQPVMKRRRTTNRRRMHTRRAVERHIAGRRKNERLSDFRRRSGVTLLYLPSYRPNWDLH